MLRRILIPFSELFILLALMFFALFFVSAALSGDGESRKIDEVHFVRITWEQRRNTIHRLSSNGDLIILDDDFSPARITRLYDHPGPSLEAMTLATAAVHTRGWDASWSDRPWYQERNFRMNLEPFPTWRKIDGKCVPAAKERHKERVIDFSHVEDPDLSPAHIIKRLATSPESNFTVAAKTLDHRVGRVSLRDQDPIPTKFDAYDFVGRNMLSVSYRPEDLERPILLRFGIDILNINGIGDEKSPDVVRFIYDSEVIGGDKVQFGSIYLENSGGEIFWQHNNGRKSTIPRVHWSPGCEDNGMVFLYITLNADGPIFGIDFPEVGG